MDEQSIAPKGSPSTWNSKEKKKADALARCFQRRVKISTYNLSRSSPTRGGRQARPLSPTKASFLLTKQHLVAQHQTACACIMLRAAGHLLHCRGKCYQEQKDEHRASTFKYFFGAAVNLFCAKATLCQKRISRRTSRNERPAGRGGILETLHHFYFRISCDRHSSELEL